MHEDIIHLPQSDNGAPFNVTLCGTSYCDETYEIKRKISSIYVLEYIVSGIGTVNHDTRTFIPKEGDVYFLKPGKYHHYYSHKENPWTKIWFNFSGELASKISEIYGLENEVLFHAPELKPYFDEIIKLSRDAVSTNVHSEIAVVFLKLAQKLSEKIIKPSAVSPIALKLKGLLDSRARFDCDLKSITDNLFCSENHAIREFKAAFSITPYEYLQQKRFKMAKSMLKNTAMSISDIAASLDFYDIHYFSICFKKRFGITPSAYRKG